MSKAKNWLRLLESLDIWLLGWDNTNGGRLSASSLSSCVCVCVLRPLLPLVGLEKKGNQQWFTPPLVNIDLNKLGMWPKVIFSFRHLIWLNESSERVDEIRDDDPQRELAKSFIFYVLRASLHGDLTTGTCSASLVDCKQNGFLYLLTQPLYTAVRNFEWDTYTGLCKPHCLEHGLERERSTGDRRRAFEIWSFRPTSSSNGGRRSARRGSAPRRPRRGWRQQCRKQWCPHAQPLVRPASPAAGSRRIGERGDVAGRRWGGGRWGASEWLEAW